MGGAGRYPSRIALVPPWGDSGGHGAPWRAALHSLRTAPTGACTPAALHLLIISLTTNANTLMVQSIYQRIYSISDVYTRVRRILNKDKLSAAGLNAVHVCGSFVTQGNGGQFRGYNDH